MSWASGAPAEEGSARRVSAFWKPGVGKPMFHRSAPPFTKKHFSFYR
jgi:hypothetical protein